MSDEERDATIGRRKTDVFSACRFLKRSARKSRHHDRRGTDRPGVQPDHGRRADGGWVSCSYSRRRRRRSTPLSNDRRAPRSAGRDTKPQRLFAGNRAPGFKSSMMLKDLNIIVESAKVYGIPLPTTAVNAQLFAALVAAGQGDLDNSAVIGVIEELARVRLLEFGD
jgi:hypothetical protein